MDSRRRSEAYSTTTSSATGITQITLVPESYIPYPFVSLSYPNPVIARFRNPYQTLPRPQSYDVVEGHTSFNLREHLFLHRDLFLGQCPPCVYIFIVRYKATSLQSYPEICTRDSLRRIILFFQSCNDIKFSHKSHKNYKENHKAETAEQFFRGSG